MVQNMNLTDKCRGKSLNEIGLDGHGAKRSYESVSTISHSLNLQPPERIISVALRKCTATLSQVIGLENNQLQWLCKHLGHTRRVHLEHYRQTLGFIERVKIGKILMVQDMNLTEKFRGKPLNEIGWDDIMNAKPSENQQPTTSVDRHVPAPAAAAYNEEEEFFEQMEMEEEGESRNLASDGQLKKLKNNLKKHLLNKNNTREGRGTQSFKRVNNLKKTKLATQL